MPNISVVIPVYRSKDILNELYQRLISAMCKNCPRFEIIMVEDSGGDGSWDTICALAKSDKRVRGIRLMRNFGQHSALLCGIRAARYETIVTMDDDLQHPPEEIPKLLNKLREGYDVVYGTPEKERHGLMRDMASLATKIALQSVMGAKTARRVSAFRAFHTRIRDAFSYYRGPFVSIDVLLTWGATRFTCAPVSHARRKIGKSNYTFGGLLIHAFNMMTGFSTIPLQLASLTGFVFMFMGIAVLIYVITRYLIAGRIVPGFPFLASIIAIFSGAQLFALGIIGEYLARMYFRIMEKPPYVIQHETEK